MSGYVQQKQIMNASLAVAVLLLAVKVTASIVTDSSAIYSDAAESVVHVLAVAFAAWALRLSHKPADDTHHFGHDKVSFVSAGFEGAMITAAAMLIFYQAGHQCLFGVKIDRLGWGAILTGGAAVINLLLGLALVRVGKKQGSPLIRANGLHVLTDVWSSVAVLVALGLIKLTGWLWWDPIAAGLAAANICHTGFGLIRESLGGLLDASNPAMEKRLRELLTQESRSRGMSYHHLRHRHSGRVHWVEFHLVCDDSLSVGNAHDLATEIESKVAALLQPDARVISHLEPKSAADHDEPWEER